MYFLLYLFFVLFKLENKTIYNEDMWLIARITP